MTNNFTIAMYGCKDLDVRNLGSCPSSQPEFILKMGFQATSQWFLFMLNIYQTINGSNATIYNSKTDKGGIVQKKANLKLFWGLPGICRPQGCLNS